MREIYRVTPTKLVLGKFPFPQGKRISKAGIVQIEKVLDQSSRT